MCRLPFVAQRREFRSWIPEPSELLVFAVRDLIELCEPSFQSLYLLKGLLVRGGAPFGLLIFLAMKFAPLAPFSTVCEVAFQRPTGAGVVAGVLKLGDGILNVTDPSSDARVRFF